MVARSRSVCQSGHGLGRTVAAGRPDGPRSWLRGRSRSACRTTVWVARSRSVGQSGRRLQWPKARIPATGRGPTCSKRGGGHEPAGTGRSLKWNDDRRKQVRIGTLNGGRCFEILFFPLAVRLPSLVAHSSFNRISHILDSSRIRFFLRRRGAFKTDKCALSKRPES